MSTALPELYELSSRTASRNEEEDSALKRKANIQAVIICLASFFIIFTSCGTLFSFGVYQEVFQRMAAQPNNPFSGCSAAAIDLIGTLSVSFQTLGSPFATTWCKQLPPRLVIATGGLFFLLGCMLASISTHLWHFLLTQGLMLGIGTCLSYMPIATIAPTWYGARRGLAMGIIFAGTGVGGVVWSPLSNALIAHFGYRKALRISGGITGSLIVIGANFIDWDEATKKRLAEEQARSRDSKLVALFRINLLNWRIAKTRKFAAQLLGSIFQGAVYYTPIFFFAAYARTLGYNTQQSSNFIALSNAFNAIGKIVLGLTADRLGRLNTLCAATCISAMSTFAFWLPSTLCSVSPARGLFITYTIFYGTFASAYVSLFPTSLVELFGPVQFASVNGFLYFARGLATLVGTPTAGALLGGSERVAASSNYFTMTIFVGSLLSGASLGVTWVLFEYRKDISTSQRGI